MKTGLTAIMVFLFLWACETLFEYHPKQIIPEEHERNLNEKNLSKILEKEPSDTICFALMVLFHISSYPREWKIYFLMVLEGFLVIPSNGFIYPAT